MLPLIRHLNSEWPKAVNAAPTPSVNDFRSEQLIETQYFFFLGLSCWISKLWSFSFRRVSIAHLKQISMLLPAAGLYYSTTDRCQNAARLSCSQKKKSRQAPSRSINSLDREAFLAPRLLYVLQFAVVSQAPIKNGKGINFPSQINRDYYKVALLPTRSLVSQRWCVSWDFMWDDKTYFLIRK